MTVPVPEGVKTWLEWQEQRKRIIREFMSINNLPPAPVVSPTCGSHSVSGMDMARPCEDRIACVIERYDEKFHKALHERVINPPAPLTPYGERFERMAKAMFEVDPAWKDTSMKNRLRWEDFPEGHDLRGYWMGKAKAALDAIGGEPPPAPFDHETAADEIMALINRTPRSPTREEIIATLKGVV